MRRKNLIQVGFWKSKWEPDLPSPEPIKWDPRIKAKVLRHLDDGQEIAAYRGFSMCRVCDCRNGSRDLSDGVYVWPSGLAHYIEKHNTGLPQEFVNHILEN